MKLPLPLGLGAPGSALLGPAGTHVAGEPRCLGRWSAVVGTIASARGPAEAAIWEAAAAFG